MAIIQGMTPAGTVDVKPYQMPIDEMAKGLISRQARADDARNAILAGESALNVDTRPLQEDWDLLHEIQSDYKKDVQQMIEDANGDFSQIPLSSLQSKAMDYAGDDRVRALTAFKVEYDAYNKIQKEIQKSKGQALKFGQFDPLTGSLRDEEGNFRNPGVWDLENHLTWQKAKEEMFFDPAIGKTVLNEAGSVYEDSNDMFTIWRHWWKKNSSNKKQLEAAFSAAYRQYSTGSAAGRQNYRWIKDKIYNENLAKGIELGPEELEKAVEEHFKLEFTDLMKKRLVTIKDEGFKLDIRNNPKLDAPGGGKGKTSGGDDEEEPPVIPPPKVTTITGEGLSLGGYSSPSEEADYIENGGGRLDGDVSEYVGGIATGTYTPPNIPTFNRLMTAVSKFDVSGAALTDGSETYFAGVLQTFDEKDYKGKENRAVLKFGTNYNFSEDFMNLPNSKKLYGEFVSQLGEDKGKEHFENIVKQSLLAEGNFNGLKADEIFQSDPEAVIDRRDLNKIGERMYGRSEWNRKKKEIIQSEGWHSSFDMVDIGNGVEIINNPMIDAAQAFYTKQVAKLENEIENNPDDVGNDYKQHLVNTYKDKLSLIETKEEDLEQYRFDNADKINQVKEKYVALKEKANALRELDQKAMDNNSLNDTYFDKYKKGEISGKKVANDKFESANKKSLVKATLSGDGEQTYKGYKNANDKDKKIYEEYYSLLNDFVYNKVDHKTIKQYRDNGKNYFEETLKKFALDLGYSEQEYKYKFLVNTNSGVRSEMYESLKRMSTFYQEWNDNDDAFEIKTQPYVDYAANLDSDLKKEFKDKRVRDYYKELESYKEDFLYNAQLYKEPRDDKARDYVNKLLKDGYTHDFFDAGTQLYRAVFDRKKKDPVLEELSETKFMEELQLALSQGGEYKVGNDDINKALEDAFGGIRMDRDNGGWVWHFNFKNLHNKNPKSNYFSNMIVEVPARSGLNNNIKRRLGINDAKAGYLEQIGESYKKSGGYYFDLDGGGTNGQTTRFYMAWSDIKSEGIKKGEYYMIGSGDPSVTKGKYTKIKNYDQAIDLHMKREFRPEVSRQIKTLRTFKYQMSQVYSKDPVVRQQIFKAMADRYDLPPLPEGQEWSVEFVDKLIDDSMGQPGGKGKVSGNNFITPGGSIVVEDYEGVKKEGKPIIGKDKKEIVKSHKLLENKRYLTSDEAIGVAYTYNPQIFENIAQENIFNRSINGVEHTYIDDPAYGQAYDYNNNFEQEFPGMIKSEKVTNASYTPGVVNFMKDLSLFVNANNTSDKETGLSNIVTELDDISSGALVYDYEDLSDVIPNKIPVISSRRSLQQNIQAYGKDLRKLTNSKHTKGAGIDFATHDNNGNLTPNGMALIKFFQSPEGQAIAYKNNMRVMYHTADEHGTDWHLHLEECGPKEQKYRGTFISQPPGQLGIISYDWTTTDVAGLTGYTPKKTTEIPDYLNDVNF